jgi:nuclear transport factor 2 (NTF2) superfamily protein
MNKKRTKIVIPKDQAVFWLDKNGRWHNEHGEFQHKKIINYFNTSIHKDENGYFLFQQDENISEKVYFHYEDTALFAVDLIKEKDITLVLNTRKRLKLKPKNLWIRDDSLYMRSGEENIKFIERGLMKISDLLEMTNNQYAIKVSGRRYRIPQK